MPQRVHVVYPGVAADFCGIARREGDGRTILAVGTIERRKNLEVLVRAISRLPRVRLVAIGPHTEYARACAQIAERLGVADRVEMPGYVSRERLLALYEHCAVAAVPSLYEGFGYAAAQALCAGVPCVVSNRSSLPEVVRADARIVDAEDARRVVCSAKRRLEWQRRPPCGRRPQCGYRSFLVGDERRAHGAHLCVVNRSVSRARPGRRCHRRGRRRGAREGSSRLRAS